jgi:hypothetical protein
MVNNGSSIQAHPSNWTKPLEADQWKEEIRSRVRPKQADGQGTRPRIVGSLVPRILIADPNRVQILPQITNSIKVSIV